MRFRSLLFTALLILAACSESGAVPEETTTTAVPVDSSGEVIPPAPEVPTGPLDPALVADLDLFFGDLDAADHEILTRIGESGDARVTWLLADILRFAQRGYLAEASALAFDNLTGTALDTNHSAWTQVTDRLIAWDLPAPPGYNEWKRALFEYMDPAWAPLFADPDADIDWRWVSWGGVRIDNRPPEAVHGPCPAGCIPALYDPPVTDAAGGDWYPDDALVFGVVIEDEARAYPKNIMEVHEMVNDTIGGRRVGIPYCTLCGSAQAYLTDAVPDGFDPLELRTTGLLSRSNKVTYDFTTWSVFDTFTGRALSGPLQDEEFTLEMVTVRTSTWGDWKAAHPGTTIVAADGGIGRIYPDDPLQGRDDDGPIFPIGDVDPRLPVQEPVLGVVAAGGTPVAFAVEAATRTLAEGGEVELAGIRVLDDGAGLRAETAGGDSIASHQAFWFAWSQFHPGTELWTGLELGG